MAPTNGTLMKLHTWLVCAEAQTVCLRICADQPFRQFQKRTNFSLCQCVGGLNSCSTMCHVKTPVSSLPSSLWSSTCPHPPHAAVPLLLWAIWRSPGCWTTGRTVSWLRPLHPKTPLDFWLASLTSVELLVSAWNSGTAAPSPSGAATVQGVWFNFGSWQVQRRAVTAHIQIPSPKCPKR